MKIKFIKLRQIQMEENMQAMGVQLLVAINQKKQSLWSKNIHLNLTK